MGGCHSLNHNLIHLVSMTTIIILSVEILEAIVDEICLHEPGSMISVQISQMMKLQVTCKSIDSQNFQKLLQLCTPTSKIGETFKID